MLWVGLGFVLVHATASDVGLNSGLRATGSVERILEATGTREERAAVTFLAASGQRVHTSVYTGLLADTPHPGQRVALAYDPREPRHARLLGADDLSVPVVLFLTVSVGLAAAYATSMRRSGISRGQPRWRASGPG